MREPVKTCNTCGHKHYEIPADAKVTGHGTYWQCVGGCNSTMFVKKEASK